MNDVVDKIRKLLRLSRSANRHEAELALQRALELAREHQIQIEQLNPDEASKDAATTHRETKVEARLSYDARYALALCRTFFRVSTVAVECLRTDTIFAKIGTKVMFVGTRADIEIAMYVYWFLRAHFARCWRNRERKLRNRQAYVHGMYLGIFAKLEDRRALEPKGTELALAGHDAYIAAVLGETTERKARGRPDHNAKAAAYAGYLDGRVTEIHGALKPSTREQPLALTS